MKSGKKLDRMMGKTRFAPGARYKQTVGSRHEVPRVPLKKNANYHHTLEKQAVLEMVGKQLNRPLEESRQIGETLGHIQQHNRLDLWIHALKDAQKRLEKAKSVIQPHMHILNRIPPETIEKFRYRVHGALETQGSLGVLTHSMARSLLEPTTAEITNALGEPREQVWEALSVHLRLVENHARMEIIWNQLRQIQPPKPT